MPRFKLTVEYDGTGIAGWQRQKDRDSVESLLTEAIAKLAGGSPDVVGAGRTDAGVHATGQVAHVDIDKAISPYNVMHGINYHLLPLTDQVAVIKAEQVNEDFHARFSATKRSYCYRIVNRQARLAFELYRAWHIPEKLDLTAMQKLADSFLGYHDFSSFRSSACQSKSPMKTLERLDLVSEGNEIRIYAEARSFLHHQVRNMVGTLRLVGNGKFTLEQARLLLIQRDRKLAGETAPAQGLCLTEVRYDGPV